MFGKFYEILISVIVVLVQVCLCQNANVLLCFWFCTQLSLIKWGSCTKRGYSGTLFLFSDMETYNSTLETIHSDKNLQEYVLGMHWHLTPSQTDCTCYSQVCVRLHHHWIMTKCTSICSLGLIDHYLLVYLRHSPTKNVPQSICTCMYGRWACMCRILIDKFCRQARIALLVAKRPDNYPTLNDHTIYKLELPHHWLSSQRVDKSESGQFKLFVPIYENKYSCLIWDVGTMYFFL